MINPYNFLRKEGVYGARTTVLPNQYDFELDMRTWWSATTRARLYSDFTGLDALYSYVMKSSTLVRAAISKRLDPLRARTFGVFVNGEEDEKMTAALQRSPLVRELIYQRGLANFTFARVVGVDKRGKVFVYPLRNLDTVNRAIKAQTYDTVGAISVDEHVNLFWLETTYQSEDTLGLLEPISRDYIDYRTSSNHWLTAGQFNAYQQMVLYYENGDTDGMIEAADKAAASIGLGEVLVAGKITDENGKITKELELENVSSSSSADTFRIYKENIDTLAENISVLVLGSSLLLTSAKNTNSERLVRAHLKGFNDKCERDAFDVQEWLDDPSVKTKLAFLLKLPNLESAEIRVKPSVYIDAGDIDTYTKMFKEMGLTPTDTFINKVGLDTDDVVGYENSQDVSKRNAELAKIRTQPIAKSTVASVVGKYVRRLFSGSEQ